MPSSLLKAPCSLTQEEQKTIIHPENEVLLLTGQVEQLNAELAMMKGLLNKGGQIKEDD